MRSLLRISRFTDLKGLKGERLDDALYAWTSNTVINSYRK